MKSIQTSQNYFNRLAGDHNTVVMGILNVTPDSFSDGGRFSILNNAIEQARQMLEDGAVIIDIGGESTRPGAQSVSVEQELQRVIPAIEAIKAEFDCCVSIDTSKAEVMEAAVEAGADFINDINALRSPGCIETVARLNVPVCLMHMQGEPRSMQDSPKYTDVVEEVAEFLSQRVAICIEGGIAAENLCLDPGFGFGKTVAQNVELLKRLDRFDELGYPLLVGMSRKSMIGQLLGREVDERLAGSLSCAVIAAMKGARIVRVHDVKETADAINIVGAVLA